MLSKPELVDRSAIFVRNWCGESSDQSDKTTKYLAAATHTDFNGHTSHYLMNGFGSLVKDDADDTQASDGTRSEYARNSSNNAVIAEIAPGGIVTCYERDSFDNVTKITKFPNGISGEKAVQEFRFNTLKGNKLEYHKDAVGREFTYELDSFGNATKETITDPTPPEGSPAIVVHSYTYMQGGLLSTTEDGLHNIVTNAYDSYGRLITITYADGVQTSEYSNLTGTISKTIDPSGDVVRFTYDELNRLKTTSYTEPVDGKTYTETRVYDAEGNLRSTQDYNGHFKTFEYDVIDRPSKRVDAAGSLDLQTLYAYSPADAVGIYPITTSPEYSYRLERNPRGFWTAKVFSKYGKVLFEYDELGRVTKHQYNAKTRYLEHTILSDGSTTNYESDHIGRIRSVAGPRAGTKTLTKYDLADRVIEVTKINNNASGNQVSVFDYNLFDSVALSIDPEQHVQKSYFDAAGNNTATIQGAGTADAYRIDMKYDARNRVKERIDGGTATTQFKYYADGLVKDQLDARNGVTHFEYGTMDGLLSTTDAENRTTFHILDGVGNVIGVVDARGGSRSNIQYLTSFTYDAANRKTEIHSPLGAVTKFRFDEVGNNIAIVSPRAATVGDALATSKMSFDPVNNLKAIESPENKRVRLARR